jgi:DNA-binding MurR/RpiR family transcriptional regulator
MAADTRPGLELYFKCRLQSEKFFYIIRKTRLMPMPAANTNGACLARIRAVLRDGPVSAVSIARFILRSPSEARFMSIARLASACGTSTASLSRFCKELDYSSFKEFQLDLAAAVAQRAEDTLDDFSPGASPAAIIRRVFECNRQSLSDTERTLDVKRLTRVATLMRKAARVFLLGTGGSALVAGEAAQRFLSLGMTAIALGDPHSMLFATSAATAKDVVTGISHTGQNSFVVEAIAHAGRRGARTVAITNYPHSPLAEASQYALITAYREHRINAAVSSSRIAQMCVIDSLYFILGSWAGKHARSLAEVEEQRAREILRTRGHEGPPALRRK